MNNIEDQPYTAVAPPTATAAAFSWWSLFGMTSVFLIILFASLFIIKALRKTATGMRNASWVKVIDRQALSGQQALYLVEIAGKLQVLGGSDHHLVKISDIDDPEVAAEILSDIATIPYEQNSGVLPKVVDKLAGLRRKKDFSLELDDFMKEANNEDQLTGK